MTILFKKTLSFITLLLSVTFLNAQENDGPRESNNKTYFISDKGSISDVQPYIEALNNANLKNHRLKNKHYTIVFEGGLKVEVLSAREIAAAGWNVNPSDYPEQFELSRNEPVFALGPDNFIIEYHTSVTKHN
ncbi:MAG: hypothetical protein K0Q95_43 [Bacteroidota bacterium]|jgi:hypothetical protein|nr:hypothetical protein [Bacteroidota bacterium]